MNEEETRLKVLQEVQDYVDANNVYKVTFGHYDYSEKAYGVWVPIQTERINILEALNAGTTR